MRILLIVLSTVACVAGLGLWSINAALLISIHNQRLRFGSKQLHHRSWIAERWRDSLWCLAAGLLGLLVLVLL
jgi:hypothetical protein